MKSSAKKVELASVDDLFSTEESRADAQREKVVEIPLSELHPFKGHPFKVKDDEAMMETADSIKQYGVLVPAIARPDPEGGYISRHGCVRVEFDQDFHYCSGEVCHTPKELFNLLADDYRTYVEIELTKGRRELTEDDEREADALCKRYLERWREELE